MAWEEVWQWGEGVAWGGEGVVKRVCGSGEVW